MRSITADERRARLGRRHRLAGEARAADPVVAADAVVALHGTDAASVFLSALARMRGGDIATVERALYEDRSLLRVLAMRRTMFVAPRDNAAVMLAACSLDVAARERRKLIALLEAAGIGDGDADAWLRQAEAAAHDALVDLGEATAPALAGADPHLSTVLTLSPGTKYEARQKMISRVLTVLGAQGVAIRTRPRGSWTSTQFQWAALDAWSAETPRDLDPARARAELARRWLGAFGPATLEDVRWWTGWTVGATRTALAAVDTAEVDLDGQPGLVLAGDVEPEPAAAPWIALLPALDPTVMGWRQRDFYLGDRGPLLFDANGNAGPSVWCDGRVAGGWAQAPDGEIRVRLLDDVGGEARAAIDAEAAALAERVGGARLAPRARGRSPVEAELLA